MDLKDYRNEIDSIDSQLIRLFSQRMETAAGIAQYKKDHGMPVLDQGSAGGHPGLYPLPLFPAL